MTKLYAMLLLALMVSATTSHARGVAVARDPLLLVYNKSVFEYESGGYNSGEQTPVEQEAGEVKRSIPTFESNHPQFSSAII